MVDMIYDIKNRKLTDDFPMGTCGFISFERIAQQIAGPGETITHLKIDDRGLTFRVDKNRMTVKS